MILRLLVGGFALAVIGVCSSVSPQAADLPLAVARGRGAGRLCAAGIQLEGLLYWRQYRLDSRIPWSDPFTGATTPSQGRLHRRRQIGYNAQFNWLVLGVEGDFDWTGLNGSGTDSLGEFHQHQDRMDLDRYWPDRRRVRPSSGLRQRRRRLRA